MSGNNYQVPDLQSVLQTLAALAPQNVQNDQLAQYPLQGYPPQGSLLDPHAQYTAARLPEQQFQPLHVGSTPSIKAPEQKGPDPATIIDWSSGLRSVMKTVAVNDNLIREIRRMIEVQHEHEEQWSKGRQVLIEKQEARKEGQKKLDEVLKAVGGAISDFTGKPSAESAEEELKTFDMKVYRAQHQMIKEFSTKLKNMGIPFFGTRSDLIRKANKDTELENNSQGLQVQTKTITEQELVEFQRRMLSLLEEMCQE